MRCGACGSESIGTLVEPGCGPVRTCNDCGREVTLVEDEQRHVEALQPKPRQRVERKASAHQPHEPIDPIPMMRARLRWLDSEIKRLRKLEVERERLSRTLSAAGKPVAVVRELRQSRG